MSMFKKVAILIILTMFSGPVLGQNTLQAAFRLGLAKGISGDDSVMEFYQSRNFQPLWIERSSKARARRNAFLNALNASSIHALPKNSYNITEIENRLRASLTQQEQGMLEAEMTLVFLEYAQDIQTGVLIPKHVDENIVRKVPYRKRVSYLTALEQSSPKEFFNALPPQSLEYKRLLVAKERLLKDIALGGWGPKLNNGKLSLGDSGPAVVALRNRLIAQGYLKKSLSKKFDSALELAVIEFQKDHGLTSDGVVGAGTIIELNVSAQKRLGAVIVAMERERWINKDLGKRHIKVNLADFHAKIYDNDRVTFKTRAVIGANDEDRRSPEFSDSMEHMIINPSWYVPRSITVKEYLPKLQSDPTSLAYLNLLDGGGNVVSREGIDFTQFNDKTFPFDLKQSPSNSNALGLVKFMFPNKYNIYLHDTPAKNLFSRESRAFSHGCIRLHQPFEFGYTLLSKQTSNPKGVFHAALDSGKETQINLQEHVPVHIMYRTAMAKPKGGVEFRSDVYGRDTKIFDALTQQGVVIGSFDG